MICKPAEPEQILRVVGEVLAHSKNPLAIPSGERIRDIEAINVLSNKLYLKIEEFEALNAELEHRVVERTAQLENANRLLQQQIVERQRAEEEAARSREERLKMKGEFLSHVSHELRSPLAVVHQFTTILLDGLGGALTTDQREYLEVSLRNVNQLKHMIDDLLEASRADTSKLTVKRSSGSLAELIMQCVKSQSAIAAEKGVALKSEIPEDLPLAYADPARVVQVLTNLLDNAIKFSPSKTTVTVRARIYEDDPNFLCVSVADCGCGIEPENAKRIFERLYQVKDSTSASRRGLGLGLYICKELIGLQGGGIWVDPKRIAGTTIHFTIPVFTINSLIAPVAMKDGQLVPFLVLITLEVSSAGSWKSERDRERALQKIHRTVERCMLPDLDAMMPTQSWGGSDFISIVARTDQQGSQVMLARLREQLSRSGDLRDAGVGWSLDGELIDLGALEKGQPLENSVTTVATYVKERLKTRIRKGERLNELQENTLGGR